MGGAGSGYFSYRRARRNLIEHAFALDIAALTRAGRIVPCTASVGVWEVSGRPGTQALTLRYDSDLTNLDEARIWFTFYIDGMNQHQTLRLAVTKPRLGGIRLWFVCPVTGRRARLLYLPYDAKRFASREAHGLTYRSQSETDLFRSITRAQKIRARLGGDVSIHAPFPPRPPGMHRRTYERLRAEGLMIEIAVLGRLHVRQTTLHSRVQMFTNTIERESARSRWLSANDRSLWSH